MSPVVVELFTSQGCSSCPDADALLSRWGKEGFAQGRVLPLSYNVDYWDHLGWKDLFSSPAYSRRQHDYARTLGVGVYTPQIVVAGRSALVGSDEARLRREVGRIQPGTATSRVRLSAADSPQVKLTVRVDPIPPGKDDLHVMLALFENDLVTEVRAGENAGSTLRNDFVVRRLRDLGACPQNGCRKAVAEAWDPSWRKSRGGAAVFLQDIRTLEILDAAWLYPLSSRAPAR